MANTAKAFDPQSSPATVTPVPSDENNKWVIIEVNEVPGEVACIVEPKHLDLLAGWKGTIVWYVFTPGYQLRSTDGVVFEGSGFNGHPQVDPHRPGCWSAAASNDTPGTFTYSVNIHPVGDPTKVVRIDPVVENDPPSGRPSEKLRATRPGQGLRRQKAS
jgi:hypothetical protein